MDRDNRLENLLGGSSPQETKQIAQEPKNNPTYTASTYAYVGDGKNQKAIRIPIPAGQEWLYATLERQGNILYTIKGWITFFGILSVISLSIGVIYLLIIIVGLLSFH
jgi:hypothetical protein